LPKPPYFLHKKTSPIISYPHDIPIVSWASTLWLIYVAPKRFGSQAPQPTGFALLVEALVTWSWEIHGIKGPELIAVTMDVPKKKYGKLSA